MFRIDEIKSVLNNRQFQEDMRCVQESLILNRYQQDFTVSKDAFSRLSYFVECVLSSGSKWNLDGSDGSTELFNISAEISELLASVKDISDEAKRTLRIRSSLLYELAEKPTIASAILKVNDLSHLLINLFHRNTYFRSLSTNGNLRELQGLPNLENVNPIECALSSDVLSLARYEQGLKNRPEKLVSDNLISIAEQVSIGFSATELDAFSTVIRKRICFATRTNVDDELFNHLKEIEFPPELWSTQIKAIEGGLIDNNYDSWGFAAPTGTGKTFLTRLLIAKTLLDNPEAKILYIVPSRALVYEVWLKLNYVFEKTGHKIVQVSPQLIELDNNESNTMAECSVAVLTPEKADLLLRLGLEFMLNTSLVIVDEAHHIENGTRGVLLELYLWRIRKILQNRTRVVFLSAVAPNIRDLTEWMGERPRAVTIDHRSTRMRVGVYRIRKNGGSNQGWIDYEEDISICVVKSGVASSQEKKLFQLADAVGIAGPVLIVAKGKKACETLAIKMRDWLAQNKRLNPLLPEKLRSDEFSRLDSRLEREMYESVSMRSLLKDRIVYHHAGLPPRVRIAVEDAIRAGLVDFVFATTTLAEGVNFPFSSVIVQSLAIREQSFVKGQPVRYQPVTPRTFWNIAGRAGRPGNDKEGQAILFEPSLGLEKVNLVLAQFLDSSLNGIEPVKSALAQSIKEIKLSLERNDFSMEALNNISLDPKLPKQVKGSVNLLRIGIVHAKALNLIRSPEEILESSFADKYLNSEEKQFAGRVVSNQSILVDDFFSDDDSPSLDMTAEIGLSIETLIELRDYVRSLENWKLEQMGQVMYRGSVNFSKLRYVISPVASRMAELEGPKLGGFYSEIIESWLSGIPLKAVNSQSNQVHSFEELISIIYSRIHYLLPWGLYATHRLVDEEMQRRKLSSYNDELLSLAFLVEAGVPSFNALRLVNIDIERVDATRLAKVHQNQKPRSDTDIVNWLKNQDREFLRRVVRGSDNRRIDYDFFKVIDSLSVT